MPNQIKFTAEHARTVFDAAIAECTDLDRKAQIELAKAYFTDPHFRKALQAYTYQLNQAKGR